MANTIRMRVSIKGDQELIAKLKGLSAKSQAFLVDVAAQAGAEVVRDQAARNAPIEHGDLRRSIHTAKVDSGS